MNDKTKEKIVKISIVTTGVFIALFLLIPFILTPIIGDDEMFHIWTINLIITFSVGFIMIILNNVWGIKLKPVDAEKVASPFDNFDSVSGYIKKAAESDRYVQQPLLSSTDEGLKSIYIKGSGLWKEDCIALLYFTELTDDSLEKSYEAIYKAFQAYYGRKRITDNIAIFIIICVDRITPTFNGFVNSNIEQTLKLFKLPVGICFEDKLIYIAKQKDAEGICQYKKLRKRFLKFMQLR